MRTGVALALIGAGLLCVEQAAAQRGGRGGGQAPPEIMPNTDKETMILSLPEEWYPTGPLGNDQLYILSKIWKYDPPNGIWRDWRNYFEEVYVCDPNRPEHPCRPMELPPRGGRGGP